MPGGEIPVGKVRIDEIVGGEVPVGNAFVREVPVSSMPVRVIPLGKKVR